MLHVKAVTIDKFEKVKNFLDPADIAQLRNHLNASDHMISFDGPIESCPFLSWVDKHRKIVICVHNIDDKTTGRFLWVFKTTVGCNNDDL